MEKYISFYLLRDLVYHSIHIDFLQNGYKIVIEESVDFRYDAGINLFFSDSYGLNLPFKSIM